MDVRTETKEKNRGRLLGIDYGSKRVGLALSDEARQFAMPLVVIANTPTLVSEIHKICEDNVVSEVILGESRDYKGKPNDIYLASIEFKEKLEKLGLFVRLEPEFMTSVQAEKLQGKNKLSDASAAAIILQSYLDKDAIL